MILLQLEIPHGVVAEPLMYFRTHRVSAPSPEVSPTVVMCPTVVSAKQPKEDDRVPARYPPLKGRQKVPYVRPVGAQVLSHPFSYDCLTRE
jgi:hypothetical protein